MSNTSWVKGWWRKFRSLPKMVQVASWIGLALLLLVAGASSGGNDSGTTGAQSGATSAPATPSTPSSPTTATEASSAPPASSPPPTPAPPSSAAGDKVMAAVKEMCPTKEEMQSDDSPPPEACTDVTGYEIEGDVLMAHTDLYPKDENKDIAQNIAGYTLAATQCGDDIGASYRSIEVQASNGEVLATLYPPMCDK